MSDPASEGDRRPEPLTADRALAIAQADAVQPYHNPVGYVVHVTLERDGWHVDYERKDPRVKGGSPRYLIDPLAGTIISKRYAP